MLTTDSMPNALRTLTHDGWLLFLTRFVRLFAYGSLSVVLVFYLIGLGLSDSQTGLLLTLTLAVRCRSKFTGRSICFSRDSEKYFGN